MKRAYMALAVTILLRTNLLTTGVARAATLAPPTQEYPANGATDQPTQVSLGDVGSEGRRVLALQADSGNARELTNAVDRVAKEFGRLDILVAVRARCYSSRSTNSRTKTSTTWWRWI